MFTDFKDKDIFIANMSWKYSSRSACEITPRAFE